MDSRHPYVGHEMYQEQTAGRRMSSSGTHMPVDKAQPPTFIQIFIFKDKHENRVQRKVHTWLSRKTVKDNHTFLSLTNRKLHMAFRQKIRITVYILQTVQKKISITLLLSLKLIWSRIIIGYRLEYLDLTEPILKVKVKVMHISTANIYKMMTDTANSTIVITYEVAPRLSINIFRFDLVQV